MARRNGQTKRKVAMNRYLRFLAFAAALYAGEQFGSAQQVHVSAPLVNMSDSFYEWYGIDWGYQSRGRNSNFFFHRGGSQGTIPAFGGFDPASAGRLGFSHQGSNHGFFFNLAAAQGSNRTITSSTPSVTLSNGAVGSVRDVQMRPFVTGLIPVVGSASGSRVPPPTLISPLKERLARLRNEQAQGITPPPASKALPVNEAGAASDLKLKAAGDASDLILGGSGLGGSGQADSSAEYGDISVAEIRRRQAARLTEQADALEQLIADARAAEAVGRFGAARVRYRQAAARASGELKRELLSHLDSIRDR